MKAFWENELAHVAYTFRGRPTTYGSYLIGVMARVEKLKARGATDIRVYVKDRYYKPEEIRVKRMSEKLR